MPELSTIILHQPSLKRFWCLLRPHLQSSRMSFLHHPDALLAESSCIACPPVPAGRWCPVPSAKALEGQQRRLYTGAMQGSFTSRGGCVKRPVFRSLICASVELLAGKCCLECLLRDTVTPLRCTPSTGSELLSAGLGNTRENTVVIGWW